MGSEDQVLELMALIDTGLLQANKMEEKLTEYERKLQVNFHTFYMSAKQHVAYWISAVCRSVCPGCCFENETNNSHHWSLMENPTASGQINNDLWSSSKDIQDRFPLVIMLNISKKMQAVQMAALIMAARQVCWLLAIMFYCWCFFCFLFFIHRLISEIAWPIATKLCHMFDGDPGL